MLGAAEVHHRQVAENPAYVNVVRAPAPRHAGRVVAGRGHHVDFAGHKHFAAVVGHKKRIGMVDRVARKSAHPQHHRFGFGVVGTDHGNIGLAEAVDLRWPHHGMALATPNIVKDAGKTHPAFPLRNIAATRAHGHWCADQPGLRVGHHQIGVERAHAQRSGQARHDAYACGQYFAVLRPGAGSGADDTVNQGKFLHRGDPQNTGKGSLCTACRPPTRCKYSSASQCT